MPTLKEIIGFLWRGGLMGAADVVPGVSGGTIAFITGIYERLMQGIRDVLDTPKAIITEKSLKPVLRIDWLFFIPLFLGIVLAFLIGAHLIPELLHSYPALVISFFIGLILASAIIVFKMIKNHTTVGVIWGILGLLIGLFISASPIATRGAPSLLVVFFLGFIAISAMLLPGISGSYILLIFGQYEFMLNALRAFDAGVVIVFILGALAGVAVLSHVITYFLNTHESSTLWALTGLMLGALYRPIIDVQLMTLSAGMLAGAASLFAIGAALVFILHNKSV